MKTYTNPTLEEIKSIIQRPVFSTDHLDAVIQSVFSEVESTGDQALKTFTSKYDEVELDQIIVSPEEIKNAEKNIPVELKRSIDQAYNNIYQFHKAQIPQIVEVVTQPGVICWQKPVPISSVGLYIPGGSAPLFSTILMLAIPARIAGCKKIVLCTPPGKDGKIPAAMLYVASLCKITHLCMVGGSQAIAAMALGTESVPQVDKIFGPGNQYVTAAKLHAFKLGKAIDMPAGPSEVLVFSDESGIPEYIAADLLSQAEHGADSQVIFVTTDENMVTQVEQEVRSQLELLPRKEIAIEALNHSSMVCVPDVNDAFNLINDYAPEHFIIASDRADDYLDLIENSGSVFIGNYTPESAGDYASGTNHTLPTAGAAKAFSGVNLGSFYKKITFQKITKEGLTDLGPSIVHMAREEQLEGHAQAVTRRIKQ
ncbi:MAG: histidinol dehydrogenase [Saprospiraceae bacterium]|nr:histidinol dehydrogenase [Saprospiraceae bacterium]